MRYTIGVIPGDGIGPEVIEQALLVLGLVASQYNFEYRLVRYPFGTSYYYETGNLISDKEVAEMRSFDALLIGAVENLNKDDGDIGNSLLTKLCHEFDLYLHIRHVKAYTNELCPLCHKNKSDVDFVIVRENSEDNFSQLGGVIKRELPGELAFVQGIFTRQCIERTVRYAYDLSRKRPRNQLTLVNQSCFVAANDLWNRIFTEVGKDYPDVNTSVFNSDMAVSLMINRTEWFDVIVTSNPVGDALMSLGAQLSGGVGYSASSFINPDQVSVFEPSHGVASKLMGTGVANPIGAIMSVARMLSHLDQPLASARIEQAVTLVISQISPTESRMTDVTTTHVGDMVLQKLNELFRGN